MDERWMRDGGGVNGSGVVACGVWRVACGVWRVACGGWRVACGVWRVACGVCKGPHHLPHSFLKKRPPRSLFLIRWDLVGGSSPKNPKNIHRKKEACHPADPDPTTPPPPVSRNPTTP